MPDTQECHYHRAEGASVHDTVVIGPYSVIHENVCIGKGSVIGSHVVIHAGSVIGENVRIDDHAVIGKQPMRALTSATSSADTQPPCSLASGCIVGTHAIVYANCKIGAHCLIADYASIRENVVVGDKNIIGRNATIENWCTVGNRCKIETNAYITAYSTLEDDVFVAPGVVTSNDNYVGRDPERFKHFRGVILKRGSRLGAQVTVLPGKTIGEEALVAAGSVVTKDLEGGMIHMGSPAKPQKTIAEEQRLSKCSV